MAPAPEYIEFELQDPERFDLLLGVVTALRQAKENDSWQDDEYWLATEPSPHF